MAKMGQEQTIERYFVGAVLKQRKGAVKWYGIDMFFFHAENLISKQNSDQTSRQKQFAKKTKQKHVAIIR